jgi:hypothetical protein
MPSRPRKVTVPALTALPEGKGAEMTAISQLDTAQRRHVLSLWCGNSQFNRNHDASIFIGNSPR